jgi:CDR ABC transporter
MQQYISNSGGYLKNPDATSLCEFCSSATTDQFLESNFNIHYSHHWRNFGLMMAFVGFNVSHPSFATDASMSDEYPYRYFACTRSLGSSAFDEGVSLDL